MTLALTTNWVGADGRGEGHGAVQVQRSPHPSMNEAKMTQLPAGTSTDDLMGHLRAAFERRDWSGAVATAHELLRISEQNSPERAFGLVYLSRNIVDLGRDARPALEYALEAGALAHLLPVELKFNLYNSLTMVWSALGDRRGGSRPPCARSKPQPRPATANGCSWR